MFVDDGRICFRMEHTLNTNEIDTSSPNDLPFYPNKVPFNLNNCEIVVSTGVWPPTVIDVRGNERGIEIDLVSTLLQHMNASINFVVDPQSFHGLTESEDKEHTGRLALLKKESFDMMAGSMPAHITIFRDFDASVGYMPNALTFIVPTAAVFPSSLILWSMLEVKLNFFLLFDFVLQFFLCVPIQFVEKFDIILADCWFGFIFVNFYQFTDTSNMETAIEFETEK